MISRRLTSPNFNERRDGQKPCMIILHYTGTPTAQEAEAIYLTPEQVSPHYMIDGDGLITQFVDDGKRAWHAGVSSWAGFTDINSASIGIEIWNTGHEYELEDFREAQIATLVPLLQDLKQRHDIPDYYILGHSDVAPGRKIDPGEKFPWQRLADLGIGLMPKIIDEDRELALSWMDEPQLLSNALNTYGYEAQADSEIVIDAFRRHFLPETLGQWGVDIAFAEALASLLRQKQQQKFDRDNSSVA